jgi:hypothetical protein
VPIPSRSLVALVVALALAATTGCGGAGDTSTSAGGDPASTTPSTGRRGGVGTVGGSGSGNGGLGRAVPEATPQYLAAAAARTAELTSGAFALGIGLSEGSGLLDGQLLAAEGEFDTASGRSKMRLDGGIIAGTTELITAGGTTYVATEGLGGLLAGGQAVSTPWIAYESPADGSGASVVPFVGSGGASSFLASLRGAGGTVTEVGTDTIDGVAVRHYRGTIDPAAATQAAPEARSGLAQLGTDPFPVEAWIDDDGIVRRLELSPSLGAGAGALGALGAAGGLMITVELRDLGRPVTIDVPPASEVTRVDPSTVSGLGAGGLGAGGLGTEGLGSGGSDDPLAGLGGE